MAKLANLMFTCCNDRSVYFPQNWIQIWHLARMKLKLLLLTIASRGEKAWYNLLSYHNAEPSTRVMTLGRVGQSNAAAHGRHAGLVSKPKTISLTLKSFTQKWINYSQMLLLTPLFCLISEQKKKKKILNIVKFWKTRQNRSASKIEGQYRDS